MTKLTQIEQETVIIFNEGEDTAHIETFNSRLKRRIKEVAAERPEDVTIESEKDGFLNAVFPKKWVKINPPKQMSEEQRAKLAERAKRIFSK